MEKKETFLKIKNTPSLFLQFSRGGQCFCFLISKDSEEVMMPSLTDVKMFWRTFLHVQT
jgi:hypothetical protein